MDEPRDIHKYREGLVCLVPKPGRAGISSHEKTLCDCQVLEIFADYDILKAQYEELLSYLPQVPTQPYEKRLAQEHQALKAELEQTKRDLAGIHTGTRLLELVELERELEQARAEIERLRAELDAAYVSLGEKANQWAHSFSDRHELKLLAESYRTKLLNLCNRVEDYASNGCIEGYCYLPGEHGNKKLCLDDFVEEARKALEEEK